jgi:hypothetical protein
MANTIKLAGQTFDVGKKLNLNELKKIERKTEFTPSTILKRVEDKYDINVGSGAKSYAKPATTESTQSVNANQPGPFNVTPGGQIDDSSSGMSREQYGDYLYNSGLITLQGNINTELEKLRSTGLSSVASIQAGATVRSAELDSESRKYLADKDYLARTDVEKIRGQSNLDLQNIINAGLKDVEGIRQQGGRDIATITGEFGVKQEAAKQRGQKEIANIGAGSAYRNALIGAFSF